MGPTTKIGAPPPPPSRFRCLLCRRSALSLAALQKSNNKLKSCATSICTIFGLPDSHPFKVIYERARYCGPCLKEMLEADVTLGKLELMKQTLLRFQNRVYSKLGDNYFQIDNRDELKISDADFESGGASLKGRKFTYDEIVKAVYEKLDKDCLKWERFSSEGRIDNGTADSAKVEASSQTEGTFIMEVSLNTSQDTSVVAIDTTQDSVSVSTPSIIIPDENGAAWGVEDDDMRCDDGGGCVSDNEIVANSSMYEDSRTNTMRTRERVEIDYGPEATGLPFTRAPINFDHKIFCTLDTNNCKRFFYDEYNLKVHIKSFHEGNPLPHECTVCLKGFVDEGRLKNHFLRVHTTSESFMCDQCGQGFPSPQMLREHFRKKHTTPITTTCSFCSAPFSSSEDQKEHEDLHRSKEFPFACVFCEQSFPNTISLKVHFSTAHSTKQAPCEICGKILASENSLKLHMNRHTESFLCDQCAFKGTSKHALKQHLLTHSTEKMFTCQYCGHSFKYAKNLNSHMRRHTGEKPYTCSLCGVSFRELSYLRRHEESHSTADNYCCFECGAGFKVKENLKKHERTHKEGYVPKKKTYNPRTEKQKLARKMKREMLRDNDVLIRPVKRVRKSSPPALSPVKTRSSSSKSTTVRAEPKKKYKSKTRASGSPLKNTKKKGKSSKRKSSKKRVNKERVSSEEDSEEDYLDEAVEEEEVETEEEVEEVV